MKIDIITLFPEIFDSVFGQSMVARGQKKGLVKIKIHNLRDWAIDRRGTVDDRPFGGGAGMVLRPEPVGEALEAVKTAEGQASVLLTAKGERLEQERLEELATKEGLILMCGHYEGFDERVRSFFDYEISVGDYILSGGEIPAMVLVDGLVRLIPGVLGNEESTKEESFSLRDDRGKRTIEYPQYTQPREWRGKKVPAVLLSGDHKKIGEWRRRAMTGGNSGTERQGQGG